MESDQIRSDDSGSLEILNVQGGDVKVTFDPKNIDEMERAKRIVEDMLGRGYALIVEIERDGKKAYERIQAFDAKRGEYIIANPNDESHGLCACGRPLKHRGRCKGKAQARKQRVPMTRARATAVGPSAGG